MMRLIRWLDSQLGLRGLLEVQFVAKIFPDHWSFMLGEIALYSFVVIVITGLYLIPFFRPSAETVIYQGQYAPLYGVQMSQAYDSALTISFDVPAGLLVRQIHHWAALIFVAAIVLHLGRVFFTGAFRHPRYLNWLVGVTLLALAMANGFSGYSIVDDLLSGTGLQIGYAVLLSTPVVGSWAAFLIFGGRIPDPAVIPRLYSFHVMLLPAILVALLAVHLGVLWKQKHTNYPGPKRSNAAIVGTYFWPSYATKALGLFFFVLAVLTALGAFVEINPVWLYGPYQPAQVSSGSQPDWYFGWLEGALRLIPSLDVHILGYLIPQPFFAGFLLVLVTFTLLYLWPLVEAWKTGDHRAHNVLDRPRDHPARTAIGSLVFTFYLILTVAGSDDVIAVFFNADLIFVRNLLRGLVFGLPLVAAGIAYYVCKQLSANRPPGSELPAPQSGLWTR